MQFCGIRSYLRQTPEGCGAGQKNRAADRVSRRGAVPQMQRSAEAKVAHLKRGVVARGPRAIAGLGKNAAATGRGLRVNSRMQAPAGPLVVRARAVRRRA